MASPRKIISDQIIGARAGWKVQGVLGDVVLDRCGRDIKRAWLVLCYVSAWGLFVEANGRPPRTDREFSTGMNVALGTSHRWRTAFGQTFPELETPASLWEQVKPGVRSEAVDVVALEVGVGEVEVPVEVEVEVEVPVEVGS